LRRLKAMLEAVPQRLIGPSPVDRPQTFPAFGLRRKRVALMPGCGQQVLAPEVNEATVRLLTRHDVEVVNVAGSGCCGSAVMHLGRKEEAVAFAKRNIEVWLREIDGAGLDAIVINASGCGTTVKDYGHLLADDPVWRQKAEQVVALAKDVSELMLEIGLANVTPRPLTVAYHSACSMQHGQKVIEQPKKLLRDAGFLVKDVPEGHICCGWAGTYQILQPELSRRLRERKVANIESLRPDIIAAGNFGCIGNIAAGTSIPIAHTVELLDWATGGPKPRALQ
jgi:glycolate oxidase iron-sulfur subunit